MIEKLATSHLKLLRASDIINKTLSPILTFSFGVTLCKLCIFAFTAVVYYEEFWIKMTGFAITNSVLYFHLFGVMLGVLWACETTTKEENEIIKHLFQALNEPYDTEVDKTKV